MKDATYWKEYREKRKLKRETEFKVAGLQPSVVQVEPKSATEPKVSSPVETKTTLKTNPDDFKGLHEPAYYLKACMFCGSPHTKLMKREHFHGYLCEAHSFL